MHLCMWVQTGTAQVKTFWRHFKVALVGGAKLFLVDTTTAISREVLEGQSEE